MKQGYTRAILLAVVAVSLAANFYLPEGEGFGVLDILHTLLVFAVPCVLIPWVLYRWNTRQRRKLLDRYKTERD